MADGKWIAGLTPAMTAVEAARIVLPARLEGVLHYLPLAATAAHRDVEHVHHWRVATRRATAALQIFGPVLRGKQARTLRKRLRRLRRAAGAARDWDVFLGLICSSPALRPKAAAPARDLLLGWAAARRREAQAEIVGAAAEEGADLTELCGRLGEPADHDKAPSSATLGDLAVDQISQLSDELDALLSPAPRSYAGLHRLRIHGKRLRYSMEVFAGCFTASFRERLYPAVEAMQTILGEITDAHVAGEHVAQVREHLRTFRESDWRRFQKPIEQMLREQRQRFPRERANFMAWLREWRRLAAGSELSDFALPVSGVL